MTNIEGTKSRQLTKDDIALMVRELVLVTLPHKDPGDVPEWVRIPRIPATQSMGRLPLNPREACHPVHVKAATWTTGRLPPNPGEACHHRSAATLGALVSLIQLLVST